MVVLFQMYENAGLHKRQGKLFKFRKACFKRQQKNLPVIAGRFVTEF
jgi:hypothetical protein